MKTLGLSGQWATNDEGGRAARTLRREQRLRDVRAAALTDAARAQLASSCTRRATESGRFPRTRWRHLVFTIGENNPDALRFAPTYRPRDRPRCDEQRAARRRGRMPPRARTQCSSSPPTRARGGRETSVHFGANLNLQPQPPLPTQKSMASKAIGLLETRGLLRRHRRRRDQVRQRHPRRPHEAGRPCARLAVVIGDVAAVRPRPMPAQPPHRRRSRQRAGHSTPARRCRAVLPKAPAAAAPKSLKNGRAKAELTSARRVSQSSASAFQIFSPSTFFQHVPACHRFRCLDQERRGNEGP